MKLITSESANGIRERFQKVTAAKKFSAEDVNAGREYVKAYVEFVHYVEGLHESVQGSGDEHSCGAAAPQTSQNPREGAYHG